MSSEPNTVPVQSLRDAAAEIAEAFDLGLEGIGRIRSGTEALTSTVGALVELTGSDAGPDGSQLGRFLTHARLTADAAEGVAASLGDSRTAVVLSEITHSLRELHKRAIELRATSMLTKISCFGGGGDGLDIGSFVTALDDRSRDLKDTVSESLWILQAVDAQCGKARKRLSDMAAAFRALLRQFDADRERLAALEAAHDSHLAATRENNSALAENVGGAVGRLIGCLQFPDSFAQRAAHLEAMLHALDDDRRAEQHGAIRRLAAAQLSAMADALDTTAGDAGAALADIRGAIGGNTGTRWSKSPSSGWISALEQGSMAISAAATEARHQLDDALEMLNATSRHLEDAAKALTASQELNAELTTSAHNAALAASRAGASTSALRTLAGSVQDIVGKVSRLASGLAAGLEALTELSSALDEAGLSARVAELDAIRERAEGDAVRAGDTFRSVERVQASVFAHAEDIAGATEKASRAFADAARRGRTLRETAAAIGPTTGPDDGRGLAPDLGWIFALYTMEEERAVHRTLFPADEGRVDAPADLEADDDLDGFLM